MRFSLITIVTALAGSALSAPTPIKRDLLSGLGAGDLLGGAGNGPTAVLGEVTKTLGGLTEGDLEGKLQEILGGAVPKLEGVMGGSLAQKLLGLVHNGAPQAVVGTVSEAIAMVQQGTALDQVNSYLQSATGGSIANIEVALNVPDIGNVLSL